MITHPGVGPDYYQLRNTLVAKQLRNLFIGVEPDGEDHALLAQLGNLLRNPLAGFALCDGNHREFAALETPEYLLRHLVELAQAGFAPGSPKGQKHYVAPAFRDFDLPAVEHLDRNGRNFGARPEAGLRKERKHKENEGRQKDGESFHGNVFLVVRSKDNDFPKTTNFLVEKESDLRKHCPENPFTTSGAPVISPDAGDNFSNRDAGKEPEFSLSLFETTLNNPI